MLIWEECTPNGARANDGAAKPLRSKVIVVGKLGRASGAYVGHSRGEGDNVNDQGTSAYEAFASSLCPAHRDVFVLKGYTQEQPYRSFVSRDNPTGAKAVRAQIRCARPRRSTRRAKAFFVAQKTNARNAP